MDNSRNTQLQFQQFLSRAEKSGNSLPPDSGRKMAVVVSPWVVPTVPLFSLTLAQLFRRAGCEVHIIWDDLPFTDPATTRIQNEMIEENIQGLTKDIIIHQVSRMPEARLPERDREQIANLALWNLIWKNKSSVDYLKHSDERQAMSAILTRNYARILTTISSQPAGTIVCPGGIYGNSGLYSLAAERENKRAAFYDCGDGRLFIGNDAVAGYFKDDIRAFDHIIKTYHSDEDAMRKLLTLAHEEVQSRMEGTDTHAYQLVPATGSQYATKPFVLIPLSIDWDAPALGRNRFFPTPYEWVLETTRHILETSAHDILIREHPYNRYLSYPNPWPRLIEERFGATPRVLYIGPDEQVNTYDLVQSAELVLPYVSTIGLESYFLGKPIIVESNVHYAHLPFISSADSKADYFGRISAALKNLAPLPTEEECLLAKLYYYFFQKAHYLYYEFTPQPDDFAKWTASSLEELFNKDETQILLDCIEHNIPIAQKNIEKLLGACDAKMSPKQEEESNVHFGANVQVIGLNNVEIGNGTVIGEHSWLNVCQRDEQVRLRIGKDVLIGRQSMISTGGFLNIGDYCLLAPRVYISDADHIFDDITKPVISQGATLNRRLTIEANCWLGINSAIIGGITIGFGCVVAAGAIVNKDIPPLSVVVGAPARIIKMYNPRTSTWESIQEPFQITRILHDREKYSLPCRSEYQALLQEHAHFLNIDPIVAGGRSL